MNRATRRQIMRQKPSVDDLRIINQREIERCKQELCDSATAKALRIILPMTCLALRDEFGFGRERLLRFARRSIGWLQALNDEEVEGHEAMAELEAETGIRVTDDGEGHITIYVPDEEEERCTA